jgi:hemerythrin-like domain-containing protein
MKPTETLMHEHQLILKVLDAAEIETRQLDKGIVRVERIEKMLDFFKNFADKCHHSKEEQHLFVRMEERGMTRDGGPIAVMLFEHDEGRMHIKAMSESLKGASENDRDALSKLTVHMNGYIALLRQHISKENNILFAMADRIFTENDQIELEKIFEDVEKNEIGVGVHEHYHNIAHELIHD